MPEAAGNGKAAGVPLWRDQGVEREGEESSRRSAVLEGALREGRKGKDGGKGKVRDSRSGSV